MVIQYGPGASIGSVWQRFGRCQRDLTKRGQCVWLLKAWAGPTRKIQTTHREVRTMFNAELKAAAVLTKRFGDSEEAGKRWRAFTKQLFMLFKRERWCYRQLFMLYFGEPVGYEPIDVTPGASSIADIISTDENCCDACYYRKRNQSLKHIDHEKHLPLLPHMVRFQSWKKQRKPKAYPASLIDKNRMLQALITVRGDVYKEQIDAVTISEEDFLMKESMNSMINTFASTGWSEDALLRWLAKVTWAWKEQYGDRCF